MRRRPNLVRTNVLVVGGGMTGLSMAMFLAWHRISCLVAERHEDAVRHPRMRALAPRVLEMFRPMGLEPRLASHANRFADRGRFMAVRGDALLGLLTPLDSGPVADEVGTASPCRPISIEQERAERVIRQHATKLGAEVQFGSTLVGLSEDGSGVMARLRRPDGTETIVQAQYLVAADGADSAIRRQLGIGLSGPGEIARMVSIVFEADLDSALRGRTVHMAYVNRPRPQTFLMSMDGNGQRWVLGTRDLGGDLTRPDCEALINAAVGQRTTVRLLPPVPGSTRPCLRFGIGAAVADRFADGRVFLVGDAAHHIPPTGGFGCALGIAEAHNLAWKLAAVVSRRVQPELLNSYEAERRPVAEFTMRHAVSRNDTRARTDWGSHVVSVADRDRVMMGWRYGADPSAQAEPGEVGTRFPHRWLPSEASTIDLFGSGFVLLTADETWRSAAEANRVTTHLVDVDLPGVAPGGAVLIRPDGFVAWRWPTRVVEPCTTLARVLATCGGHDHVDAAPTWHSTNPEPAITLQGGDLGKAG